MKKRARAFTSLLLALMMSISLVSPLAWAVEVEAELVDDGTTIEAEVEDIGSIDDSNHYAQEAAEAEPDDVVNPVAVDGTMEESQVEDHEGNTVEPDAVTESEVTDDSEENSDESIFAALDDATTDEEAVSSPAMNTSVSEDTVNRSEWVHQVVSLFDQNEGPEYSDSYFSDYNSSEPYYSDVMRAVSYGAIALKEGESFEPDAPATRGFATHVLNTYLGFILSDGDSVTLNDNELSYPVDAQVAIKRGWLSAEDGCFHENQYITEQEANVMLEDAAATAGKADKPADDTGGYTLKKGVIQIPLDTEVDFDDENGIVTLTNCDVSICQGDTFVINWNGLPLPYQAIAVTTEGNTQTVCVVKQTQEVFESIDEQGYIELTDENCCFEPVCYSSDSGFSGPEIDVGNVHYKDGKCWVEITGVDNETAEIYISNMSLNYSISDDGYSITVSGTAGYTGNLRVPNSVDIPLVDIRIYGVGSIKLAITMSASAEINAEFSGCFCTGFAVDVNGTVRMIKEFQANNPNVEGKGELQLAIKATAGLDIVFVSADVYTEVGVATQYTSRMSKNQTTGHSVHCQDFKFYMFTEAGIEAQYYAFWNGKHYQLFKDQFDLPDNIEKPFIFQYHFEDGDPVNYCSYGMQVEDLHYGGMSSTFSSTLMTDNRARVLETTISLPCDLTIDDDYTVSSGTLDLNGHVLTIEGDLIQTGGEVYINGGRLIVKGNYKIQGEDWKQSEGRLRMESDEDQLDIDGDFIVQSNQNSTPEKGIIRLKGNFYQYNTNKVTTNYCAGYELTVNLCGGNGQIIHFDTPEKNSFGNLLADYNVSADGSVTLCGGNLKGHSMLIPGTLYVNGGTLVLNGGSMWVDGDAVFATIDRDGRYDIVGWTTWKMDNEDDLFVINGNLITYFFYGFGSSTMICSAGTLKLKGNWINYNNEIFTSDDFVVDLCGDNDQTICNKHSNPIPIANLIFQNPENRLLYVEGPFNITNLDTEDIFISANSNANLSFDTTKGAMHVSGDIGLRVNTRNGGDITVDGNLRSCSIQLSGKKLTVRGDMILNSYDILNISGGTVTVGGGLRVTECGRVILGDGQLTVTGDAVFANINSDGTFEYSNAGLTMDNENGIFEIGGNFLTNTAPDYIWCHGGMIALAGNWTSIYSPSSSSGFVLKLTGAQNQSLISPEGNPINVHTLMVEKAATRSIVIDRAVSTSSLQGGDISIIAQHNPIVSIGTTSGKLNISGNATLQIGTKAGGEIVADGNINCQELILAGNQMTVFGDLSLRSNSTIKIGSGGVLTVQGNMNQTDGTVNPDGGTLHVKGDYTLASRTEAGAPTCGYGRLNMTSIADLVIVEGDYTVFSANSSYLSAGTMKIAGNFSQLSDREDDFYPTGTHEVILNGTQKQIVSFSSTNSQFCRLLLEQDITQYEFSPDHCWTILEDSPYSGLLTKPVIYRINVSPSEADLLPGDEVQFVARVSGFNHPSQAVVWSVSGNQSASTRISEDGTLVIGAEETATQLVVTVSSLSDEDKTATVTVNVFYSDHTPTVRRVLITPASATIAQGDSEQFTAMVTGTNQPSQNVIWSVSGNADASTYVTQDGLLMVGDYEPAGTLTITAVSSVDQEKTASISVNTVELPVIHVSYQGATLYENDALPALSTASGDTKGTVTLDAGQSLSVGTNQYSWTFIPDDPDTFASATGTITLSVESKAPSAADLDKYTLQLTSDSYIYTGEAIQPIPVIMLDDQTLEQDTDYTVTYSDNTNVGTATISVTGKGNYTGSIIKTFTITAASVANADITGLVDQIYTGSAITQIPIVRVNSRTLTQETDYTVTYSDNTEVGTATMTVTGKGNYTGSISKTFTIIAASCEHNWDAGVITTEATCNNDGVKTFTCTKCKSTRTETIPAKGHSYKSVVTAPTCTERGYTTHTCKWCNDSYQDTYTNALGHSWNNGVVTKPATVSEEGVKTFTCTRCSSTRTEAIPRLSKVTLKAENVTVANGTFVYSGKAQQPAVTVKYGGKALVKGTDYTVSYSNNTNAGTATVTVIGKGNYAGSISKTFTIAKADQTVTVTAPASVVKGKTVTVTATGFGTVSYTSSNTKIATVTAKGEVKGIAPGTVTITVKAAGNGNYNAASTTVKITVNLPTPNVTKVENVNGGVKITVGKVAGAAKYRLFYKTGSGKWTKLADTTSTTYTWKKAKSGTTYAFTVRCISQDGKSYTSDYNKTGKSILYLAVPTLANSAAKTMKVTWKSASGVTGYQVSYATSSKFSGAKTVTVKNAKTLTTTIKNLKKGTTYYVRFRAYTTKNGKTTYSAWSAAKNVKITK